MISLRVNVFIASVAIITFIATPCCSEGTNLIQLLRQLGIPVSLPPNTIINTQRSSPQPCIFTCPSGQPPVPRPGHIPQFNGCGSYGFERLLIPDFLPFVDCCNQHDVCYDTCGTSKFECDRWFQACLLSKCRVPGPGNRGLNNNQQVPLDAVLAAGSCTPSAELIATGPIIAGCNAFMLSQMNACSC